MDRLLETKAGAALVETHGRIRAKQALREAADAWRAANTAGGDPAEAILAAAARALAARPPAGPRRVLNATGVLLHTNLGRAPLARGASFPRDRRGS